MQGQYSTAGMNGICDKENPTEVLVNILCRKSNRFKWWVNSARWAALFLVHTSRKLCKKPDYWWSITCAEGEEEDEKEKKEDEG